MTYGCLCSITPPRSRDLHQHAYGAERRYWRCLCRTRDLSIAGSQFCRHSTRIQEHSQAEKCALTGSAGC